MTNENSQYNDEFWKSSDFPWSYTHWVQENDEARKLLEQLSPRPSSTKAGLVAYYQTPEKRARDILTPIKPGRFLKKYFSEIIKTHIMGTSVEEVIQSYSLEWVNAFARQKLTITQDSDEIEAVYKSNKLGSCMWFGIDDYDGNCHPARVYGGNLDLGIAYIGTRDDCAGRCLVWPKKKIYCTKMYGDTDRLEAALQAEGYQQGCKGDFEGARLLCIADGDYNYVMPYLDVIGRVKLADGVFILSKTGSHPARETDGLLGYVLTRCGHCEDPTEGEDLTWVEGIQAYICSHCLENHYFRCEVMNEYYYNDDRVDTEEHRCLSRRGLASSDTFSWCEWSELYLHEDDHRVSETSSGEMVSETWLREQDYWYCEITYLWYPPDADYVAHTHNSISSIDDYRISEKWIKKHPNDYQEYLRKRNLTPIDSDDAAQLEIELGEAA